MRQCNEGYIKKKKQTSMPVFQDGGKYLKTKAKKKKKTHTLYIVTNKDGENLSHTPWILRTHIWECFAETFQCKVLLKTKEHVCKQIMPSKVKKLKSWKFKMT